MIVQNAIHVFSERTSEIRFELHWSNYIFFFKSNYISYDFIGSLQMIVLSFDSQYNSHPKKVVRSEGILMFFPFISITHCFCHLLLPILTTLKIERNEIKA